jgi:hypothetical protein
MRIFGNRLHFRFTLEANIFQVGTAWRNEKGVVGTEVFILHF